ncbi:MAG: hypothetical protein A2096_13390 [Spirochaetes bacterium GWF1_41_5]|nr:MAG: hypothetical protein A2096_13390 [Spirochaetes bacterium GWF1_41_5]HBE01686.1 hypothetical protein [Spirochaetia bacterium]
MKFNKIFLVLLAVTLSLSLVFTGCQGRKKTKKTVIRFLYWETSAGLTLLKRMIIRYMKANPDVEIIGQQIPSNQYQNSLLTQLASGKGPDIFELNMANLPVLVRRGQALNISRYLQDFPGLALANFFPESMYFLQFDEKLMPGSGDIYGYPKDFSASQSLYCNSGIFERMGIPVPDKSIDEAAFGALIKKLTLRDNTGRGLQYGYRNPGFANFWWVLKAGGKLFSDDGKKCIANTPENLRGLRFYADLYQFYKAVPNRAEAESGGLQGIEGIIGSGKFAILPYGRYIYPNMKMYSKDNWEMMPLFYFSGQKANNMITPPSGWTINAHTDKPREVVKFLEYLMSEEGNIMIASLGYNIPPHKKVGLSEHFYKRTDADGRINRYFIDELEKASFMPYSPYASMIDYSSLLEIDNDRIASSSRRMNDNELKEILKNIEKTINNIISDNLK